MARRARNPLSVVTTLAISGALAITIGYFFVNRIAHRVDTRQERIVQLSPRVALLSARRAPNTLSTLTRVDRVKRSLADFSSRLPSQSCLTVNWMGQSLLSLRSNLPLIPASSLKLVTAAVAIEVLGKDFLYTTNVHGVVDVNGVVNDLYFVGGGDPNLIRAEYPSLEKYPTTSGTSMEQLADSIVAAGVRQVAGSVVGVDNRYDTERFVSVWPTSFRMAEAGPLGALFVDDGMVLGQQIKPDNPALSAAQELTNMLQARGISIGALPRYDLLPNDIPVIAKITSAALPQVLQEMLVNSDNNTAELLLKEIGYASKKIGTTASGLEVVQKTLSEWKLDGLTIADGSGLASTNKITCGTLQTILKKDAEILPPLLAIAGQTGTIREVFQDSSAKGRLVAKTGTLNGVKSLAGYLTIENTEPVVFSLILNGVGMDNQSSYRPYWNSLAEVMLRAKSSPSPEQLLP